MGCLFSLHISSSRPPSLLPVLLLLHSPFSPLPPSPHSPPTFRSESDLLCSTLLLILLLLFLCTFLLTPSSVLFASPLSSSVLLVRHLFLASSLWNETFRGYKGENSDMSSSLYQWGTNRRSISVQSGPRWGLSSQFAGHITGGHGPGSGKVPQKESMEFLQTRGQSHFVVETKLRAAGVRAVGCSSYRLWAWSWLRGIVSTQRDEFSPDHSQSHFVVKINLDRSVLFSQGPVYTFRSRVPAKCTQNLARKVNFYRDLFSPKPPCH